MLCASLSLDDEADLYLSAFFHEQPQARAEPAQYIAKTKAAVSPALPRVLCYRCGRIGHLSSKCSGDLPAAAEIEAEMESDLDRVYREIVSNGADLVADDFGVYSNALMTNAIPTKFNMKSGSFCMNCGEMGHITNKCKHTSMRSLINEMKSCFSGGCDQNKTEEVFYDYW